MYQARKIIFTSWLFILLVHQNILSHEKVVQTQRLKLTADTVSGAFHLNIIDNDITIYIRGIFLDHSLQQNFQIIDDRLQNENVVVDFEITGERSVAVTCRALDEGNHTFEIIIENHDETDYFEYYGGGERYRALNHRGFILPMTSTNRWRNKGVGSYKPVPFVMSTQGYGVWVDNYVPGTFDLHATDRSQFVIRYPVNEMRVVFLAGPKMTDMLDEFTRLTGRPRVPPKWAFGLWKSRNVHEHQDSVMLDIESHRKYDIPANVIVLDSPWEYGYNDFRINRQQFPNPDVMFDRIEELGFYTCLWLTPFINSKNAQDMVGIDSVSSNYEEAVEKGVLITDKNGDVATMKWWKGEGGLIDFTNPKALDWYHQQLEKTQAYRAKAFKCDDGEGDLVPDAKVFDGTSVAAMKNKYSLLYNQATQEYVDKYLNGDGVLLVRSGYSGNQKYPFTWAADNSADFSYADGLPTAIIATQNMGMSGVPMYGADIAGYFGAQTKELFLRWTQFSAFTPFFQIHMISNLGPWDFDQETLVIFRRYAKLRVQLFPYLYEAVLESHRNGMPVVRPMALAFQDDEQARKEIYQFMFGPNIMVAPIYQSGTHRNVYLPEGTWFDFWNGEKYDGGQTFEIHAPLHKIPLFVKTGAIIPMLPDDIETLIPRHENMSPEIKAIDDDLTRMLEVLPGEKGVLKTYEGVSANFDQKAGKTIVTIGTEKERPIVIRLRNQKIKLEPENGTIDYDENERMTIIRLEPFQGERKLTWIEKE